MSRGHGQHYKRREVLQSLGAVGAVATLGGVAAATPGRKPGPKKDEVLVGVAQGAGKPEDVVKKHVPKKAEVAHSNDELRYVAVKFPEKADKGKEKFIENVTNNKNIKYAEENETHTTSLTPNDPQFGDQYAPDMVNAPTAWDTTTGSTSVTVAVVDTGTQYDHPDLSSRFGTDEGYDFVDNDTDPYPDDLNTEYHGTHVSGIAAASTDNDTGVAGISDSTLLSVRGLNEDGSGATSDIADGIQWAADNGADVINLSLGGGGYSDTMKNAVSYAEENGVFLAAAAGNAGENSVDYPAAYSECLAVSALDPDGTLASYSNYGSEIELAAPGSDVLSTTTEARGSYEKLSGTSMATPVVSGCAGLTLATWDIDNRTLRDHLKSTADDIGLSSDKQGSGRVDAQDAVETDPSSGGGGGGSDSTSASVSDSLAGYWDEDCWSYAWEYDSTSKVVVELDGPSDADFDLYVNTGTTDCPTTSSYDYRSWSTDSQETISIDNPDTSTDMHVLVDSYSGDGDYTLTITEYSG